MLGINFSLGEFVTNGAWLWFAYELSELCYLKFGYFLKIDWKCKFNCFFSRLNFISSKENQFFPLIISFLKSKKLGQTIVWPWKISNIALFYQCFCLVKGVHAISASPQPFKGLSLLILFGLVFGSRGLSGKHNIFMKPELRLNPSAVNTEKLIGRSPPKSFLGPSTKRKFKPNKKWYRCFYLHC